MTKRVRNAGLLLLLALSACGGGEDAETFRDRYLAATKIAGEGQALARDGRAEAAREVFLRAFDRTWPLVPEAPPAGERSGEDPVLPDVLNQLSYLANEICRSAPDRLAQSIRYARLALTQAERDWPMPHLNLGIAYLFAGMGEDSIREIETGLSLLPTTERPPRESLLIDALRFHSFTLLQAGRPGAAGHARFLLKRAWDLLPDAALNTPVFKGLAELQRLYETSAKAATEKDDLLALAGIHAEYGFYEEADEYLTKALNRLGRTEELRWTEARFVCELTGQPAQYERAVRIYDEMLGRGERIPDASAGWVRASRRLGRAGPAIERFGDTPEPSPELRAELVRCHLDVIRGLPPDSTVQVEQEFDSVAGLLRGEVAPDERAALIVTAGFLAADRSLETRLTGFIRELQSRAPNDLRVHVLDARLQELRKAPLPGWDEREGGE